MFWFEILSLFFFNRTYIYNNYKMINCFFHESFALVGQKKLEKIRKEKVLLFLRQVSDGQPVCPMVGPN